MLLLLVVLPVVGILVGLIGSFIAQWLYLVVVFPLGMGFATGAVGRGLVKIAKVRAPVVLGFAAALTAVLTILGVQFGGFLRMLSVAEQQVPGVRAKALKDPWSFCQFVDRQAEEGVNVAGRIRASGTGLNLGYAGTYAFWSFEAILVGVVLFGMLQAAAQAPLCELCRRWKMERLLGWLPSGSPDRIADSLRDGELLALLADVSPTGNNGLVLKAAVCPTCGSKASVDIGLEQLSPDAKGRKPGRLSDRICYPGDVLPFLDVARQRA